MKATCTIGGGPGQSTASPPNCLDGPSMFNLDLIPLSDAAHLNLEFNDLEWAASMAQADAAPAVEYPQAQSNSSGSAVEPLDSILPEDRGLHFLTLLSKGRPSAEPRSAASANADTACMTSPAQVQSDAHLVDKLVVQREKNKRAQKRHRDRMRVRLTLKCDRCA